MMLEICGDAFVQMSSSLPMPRIDVGFRGQTPEFSDVLDFGCLAGPEAARAGWRRHILTKHDPGGDYSLPLVLSEEPQTRELFVGGGGRRAIVRVGSERAPERLDVSLNGQGGRCLMPLLPPLGGAYVEGVAWNDYARRICRNLTEVAPYFTEYEFEAGVAPGHACIGLSGQGAGDILWLEIRVEG